MIFRLSVSDEFVFFSSQFGYNFMWDRDEVKPRRIYFGQSIIYNRCLV